MVTVYHIGSDSLHDHRHDPDDVQLAGAYATSGHGNTDIVLYCNLYDNTTSTYLFFNYQTYGPNNNDPYNPVFNLDSGYAGSLTGTLQPDHRYAFTYQTELWIVWVPRHWQLATFL